MHHILCNRFRLPLRNMLQDFQPRYPSKSAQPKTVSSRSGPEVVVAGAGIIGLSIALELHHRGVAVTVQERGKALQQASRAAAGMLAAEDPHNPPTLLPLSRYSLSLYPEYLQRIESLSGLHVPFQTSSTVQYLPDSPSLRLAEHSLDPRQLAEALLAAVRNTSIVLSEDATLQSKDSRPHIIATGAWSNQLPLPLPLPVHPRKGQMLRVKLPPHLQLDEVHRSEHVYVVPRTQGPQAGTALIGATVEDAGFDVTTHPSDLAALRALAANFIPELASEAATPMVEAWAGLRPGTADQLPILGRTGDTLFATGHFRNGILLAPATATLIADLFEGKHPSIDLSAFAPERFQPIPA
jgi:glycine oxidase